MGWCLRIQGKEFVGGVGMSEELLDFRAPSKNSLQNAAGVGILRCLRLGTGLARTGLARSFLNVFVKIPIYTRVSANRGGRRNV